MHQSRERAAETCGQLLPMKNILIVDDEHLILHALSSAFRREDTSVRAVSCGKDALTEIDNTSFHLCFLDIHLPDMNGLDIMKKVRKDSPDTKIVIMTATEVDTEMLKSIQENANLLVSKPFDLDRIRGFVDHIFAKGRPVFGTGKPFYNDQDNEAFMNWLMDEKRKQERYATLEPVSCSLVTGAGPQGEKDFSATIVDINDIGMGIQTNRLLKPGSVLRFSDSAELFYPGIVRWSISAGSENVYRAGIQFMTADRNKPGRSAQQA
jgi:CheY-like chemotaxis protein